MSETLTENVCNCATTPTAEEASGPACTCGCCGTPAETAPAGPEAEIAELRSQVADLERRLTHLEA